MQSKTITLILAIFVAIAAFAFIVAKQNAPTQLTGRKLPQISLPTLSGNIKELSNISQMPALLISFASWCVTCKAEHPFLMKLKEKNVPMYGLAWMDKPNKTARYLQENGNPFITVFMDETTKQTAPLGISGTPEIFVLKNGHILYKHVGPIDEKIWNDVLKPMFAS